MKIFLFFSYFFVFVNAITTPKVSNLNGKKIIPEYNVNEVLKFKNMIPEISYSELIHNIDNHDIAELSITSNLDTIVSENENKYGSLITDYSITKVNPYLINSIVERTNKEHIQTTIMQPVTISFPEAAIQNISIFTVNYLFPFLFLYLSGLNLININFPLCNIYKSS